MNKELYSKEAEESIIACLSVFEDCNRYIKKIEIDDFFIELNQQIMQLIKELYENSSPINLVTIKEKAKDKKLNATNIFNYLITISENVITSAEIDYYIKILKNYSIKRKLLKATKAINDKVFLTEVDIDAEELKKECINEIVNIKTQITELKDSDMTSVMNIVINDIEDRYKNRDNHIYETGFFDLDKATNGLHKQELTIIAARPGVGKTALALNIAERLANKGVNTYFVSLEMSKEQLGNRLIASKTNIDSHKLRSGWLEEKDWGEIGKTAGQLSELKMIIDTKSKTIQEIEIRATELKENKNIGLIVIDYLQLLKSKNKFNIREQEVAEISRNLKLLSRDLNIPVIALCQLNRASETRRRPILADLRESGSLEQDADNVIFIYASEEEKEKQTQVIETELVIAKQRNGATGTIKLNFNRKTMTFKNRT